MNNRHYKIIPLDGTTWQVFDGKIGEVDYQGSLADCEAYIKLEEGNYFDYSDMPYLDEKRDILIAYEKWRRSQIIVGWDEDELIDIYLETL